MTTAEIHEEILRRAPAYEDHEFLLTTDGSGHDGQHSATGSSWVLRPHSLTIEEGTPVYRGWCGASFGSIQRAEINAMMEGLRHAARLLKMETMKDLETRMGGAKLRDVTQFPVALRPRIWWVTDREAIALQVARNTEGLPYYTRRTEPDLWYQFAWFEHLFRITAVFTHRNTSQDQKHVDAIAGEMRRRMMDRQKIDEILS
jgi:hypothetical protein